MKTNKPIAKVRPKSKWRGVVTVEFAVTVPVLFLYFFAQVEFSRANMVRHALRTGCYEGCRAGIVLGRTANDVRAAAEDALNSCGLSQYTIEVTPTVITSSTRSVTVDISASIVDNSWITPLFTEGIVLSNSMTMERELVDQTIF